MMTAKLCKVLMVTFFAIAFASFAQADTITDSDVQFTATVSGSTVTLQVQCLDTSVCGSWYLGDVSLKGFTFTGSPSLGPAPSGYTVQNGAQNNDAVGGGGGCNSTQTGMAVCWDAPTTLSTQLGGGVNTFTANITNGSVNDTLHVQATAYDNTSGTQQGGGKVLAVSDDLLPGGGGGGGGSTVPEPSTLLLFGSAMPVLAGLRRYVFSKPS